MSQKRPPRPDTGIIKNVEKAFELLALLTERDDPVSLGELNERLGLGRERAVRLVMTMQRLGLLERNATGAYGLGIGAVELGQKVLARSSVVRHARPLLAELVRKHDEAVYLTVLEGDETVFLEMVDCRRQVRATPLVGKRFPFFTNAAGKLLKSLETGDFLERIGRKKGIPAPEMLATELGEIRQKGVAVETGGLGDGIMTVAVAVKDYAGRVVGALTLLGPSFRLLGERVDQEIIPSLTESALQLSMKFGHAPA